MLMRGPMLTALLAVTACAAAAKNVSMIKNGPIDRIEPRRFGSPLATSPLRTGYLRPCYFTNWAQYRQGRAKYVPEDYIPGLCTHILFAFGWMNDDFSVRAFDPADLPNDWAGQGMFKRVNALKLKQPGLKTLLSIGGWSFGTGPFKAMSATEAGRKKFIDSAVSRVREWGFDGIDIDWEYPSGDIDKRNLVSLISELREACEVDAVRFGKERLLVTAAVSGGEATIKQAYDIPALADKFDFILLMNYDFHGAWSNEIGFNSPLYSRENMVEWQKVWNIDWAARHWADAGMPREKIIIGIATYGRGWTLKDKNNHTLGAEGTPARTTKYVGEAGVAAYYEFCEMLSDGAKRYWDSEQQVPYLVYGDQWFGYDDEESITNKIAWLKRNKYGGAFVWTLDFDDFNAKCPKSDGQPYPLISIIARELGGVIIPKVSPPSTTPRPVTTTTTPKPEVRRQCERSSDGFFSLQGICDKFLLCLNEKAYIMDCPVSLHYSASLGFCVEPKNSGCIPQSILVPTTPSPKFVCMEDGFYPDKSDCKRFIRCVGGTAHSFDCPPSLSFNKHTLQCDHPNDANCA